MAPGNAIFNLWPDVSQLPEASLFSTDYRHADGRPANLFSSILPDLVAMHFRWMREYGLDGIFLQRFANELKEGRTQRRNRLMLEYRRKKGTAWKNSECFFDIPTQNFY